MKIILAAGCLAFACAAADAADTIYKYRGADGRMRYSDRPIPGAKLIESYEHEDSSAPRRDTSKSDAEAEERIRLRLSNLDAAWVEVKESAGVLAAAEARLAAGITPAEAEVLARGGPEAPLPVIPVPETPPPVVVAPPPGHLPGVAPVAPPAAPPAESAPAGPALPSVGGPMTPVARNDGGPAFVTPPSVGGPMAPRRGGGMRPEYVARMSALETDVTKARVRNQEAWSRYNQLR